MRQNFQHSFPFPTPPTTIPWPFFSFNGAVIQDWHPVLVVPIFFFLPPATSPSSFVSLFSPNLKPHSLLGQKCVGQAVLSCLCISRYGGDNSLFLFLFPPDPGDTIRKPSCEKHYATVFNLGRTWRSDQLGLLLQQISALLERGVWSPLFWSSWGRAKTLHHCLYFSYNCFTGEGTSKKAYSKYTEI